jgi:hypothetical protein
VSSDDDQRAGEVLSRQSDSRTQQQPVLPPAKLNMLENSSLATLTVPINALIELFPCAAALWSADRSQCVFNSAMQALVSYRDNEFCADENLWLRCIDPRDREAFLSSWKSMQEGQAKISCRYRFSPRGRMTMDLEENAMSLPLGTTAMPAVLSLYQSKGGIHCERRDATAIHRLAHHIGNSLQAIRGEVDLLHLTGALPQRSFDNITQGIEQLHDLLSDIDGFARRRPVVTGPWGKRRRCDGRQRLEKTP